jgi:hypothetical protein
MTINARLFKKDIMLRMLPVLREHLVEQEATVNEVDGILMIKFHTPRGPRYFELKITEKIS